MQETSGHENGAEPVDLTGTPVLPVYVPELHEAQEPEPFTGGRLLLKRVLLVLAVVGFVVLLIVIPPLVNISRYQRQIATSIGSALGRPVHMNSVTLNLLPMPGFTIDNFVVEEDPAFGAEPIIRANSVRATLRFSSVWHHRVEFSTISLTDPSVNLVHMPDGRWNIDSILVQASRVPAAPTAQKQRTLALRFPYIEATGARLNLKMGPEKTPFSLTDAEFALWLPEPNQWHLRLEAHPARTDTSVTDTGLLRVEGTIGRAGSFDAVPLDLTSQWRTAPLGSVSLIALGQDVGLRGDMSLEASVHGTVGEHQLAAHLRVTGLRRADFVPAKTLEVDIACSATGTGVLHSLTLLQCAWPPQQGGTAGTAPPLSLAGKVPDVWHPDTATGKLEFSSVPDSAILDTLRIVSSRIPGDLTLAGTIDGSVTRADGNNTGTITIAKQHLARGKTVLTQGDAQVHVNGDRATIDPVLFALGPRQQINVGAAFDRRGYEISMQGSILPGQLKQFVEALPGPGEGWIGTLPQPATQPKQKVHATGPQPVQTPVPVNVRVARTWSGDPAPFELPAKPHTKRRRAKRLP
jgi:AsmA protein